MARPKKANAVHAHDFLGLRIPEALKKAIKVQARKNRRSLGAEVRHLLEAQLGAHAHPDSGDEHAEKEKPSRPACAPGAEGGAC